MRTDSGFTLLEVLVAFIIAAAAVGALLQGAGTGLAAARVAAHYNEALSLARSRMAALSVAPPSPGEQAGSEPGGFAWRSTVLPAAVTPRAPAGSTEAVRRAALYMLTVSVSWTGDGAPRQVVLTTQRLADAPAAPP